ncbi:recombinase RecA [Halobacteriales archaeon QS_1_67_19]|nr:MAG: recombinase RecA [Halobacteriales archaeon QS_1_67_19]
MGTTNDSEAADPDADDSDADNQPLCDFCSLPCLHEPVTVEHEETTYKFCTEACRDAMFEMDRVFTEYRGFRRIRTGVAGLDRFLPEGFPRNSFVLLRSDEGSRNAALLAELVWRALERDEPAVFVTFTEPPVSIVEQFLSLDWNVLPYLESGQLHIVDCFTYRVGDRERMFRRMDEWNRHLHRITSTVTMTIRDPSDVSELQNKLDNCLESLQMGDQGVVVFDSLTEFGTHVQPVQAYDFVKDIRADVCKGRFVPVFAGATFAGDDDLFPHDLGYVIDGIIDMQLNGSIVEDTLIKRLRIRKMNGVLTIPEWVAYEFTSGTGLVTFDPIAEMDDDSEADRQRPPVAPDRRGADDGPQGPRPTQDDGEAQEGVAAAPPESDDPDRISSEDDADDSTSSD